MAKTFDQVAEIVANRLSCLLRTDVFIKNSKQGVVASQSFLENHSVDGHCGDVFDHHSSKNCYLKLPFYVHEQAGEIHIAKYIDGEVLSPKLAQAFVDLVVSRVAYPAFPDQQIFKNQIISNLLRNKISDEKAAQQQANLLGIDFSPPRAVILVDATEYILSISDGTETSSYNRQRYSQSVISSIVNFFNLPDDTICADLGGGEFAVLKASDTKNLSPWAGCDFAEDDLKVSSWMNLEALKRAGHALLTRLRSETGTALSVGIGRYHPGILGLSRSYQDARVALRLGRQFNGENQVYCLDHLGIAAFACVADESTKVELALHLLSPLDDEPELINTLKVFFSEDCTFSSTAKRLCIHRNTLTYRLEKITSLTGLDPRCFDEAVQIRLALLLKEFRE